MWYKGAPLDLVKKMNTQAELEKAKFQMLIQNNEKIVSFIGSMRASYVRLYSSLDVLVIKHQILSIGSITDAKPKNEV